MPRTGDRRLRVGYVSPDFANKSSRHFIEPMLVGHDRSKVESLLLRRGAGARYRDRAPQGAGRALAHDRRS